MQKTAVKNWPYCLSHASSIFIYVYLCVSFQKFRVIFLIRSIFQQLRAQWTRDFVDHCEIVKENTTHEMDISTFQKSTAGTIDNLCTCLQLFEIGDVLLDLNKSEVM